MSKTESKLPAAVVTGASKGIGSGIAESFCRAGYHVILISRGEDVYEQEKHLAERGFRVSVYRCDITDRRSVRDVIEAAVRKTGGIRVLVNNAGVSGVCPFEEIDDAWMDRQISTNMKGTVYVTQAVIPYMKKAGFGRIINMSSVTGAYVCDAGYSSYAMTKSGLIGLTKALAVEYARYHITCNAICPGFIKTPAVMRSSALTNPLNPKEVLDEIASGVPLGRLGTPEEIGGLAVFLAGDSAGYITGTANVIDGGSMLPETTVNRLQVHNE